MKKFIFIKAFRNSNSGKKHYIFGQSNVEEVAAEHGISVMEMTKRKQSNWKNKKRFIVNNSFDWEVA